MEWMSPRCSRTRCCAPCTRRTWPAPPTYRILARQASIQDRKSTRLNSSHTVISYAVFCLKQQDAQESPQPLTDAGRDLRLENAKAFYRPSRACNQLFVRIRLGRYGDQGADRQPLLPPESS